MIDKKLYICSCIIFVCIGNACFCDKIFYQRRKADPRFEKAPYEGTCITYPDAAFMVTDALGCGEKIIISGNINMCEVFISMHMIIIP